MTQPPTTKWPLKEGNKYLTFLSHFKMEAGSDARYLSDLIRRMTGCSAYLDSTDLVDLRTLFNEGVHKTDVIVILVTRGVFTRPWCLMEMWEAAVHQVPIVLFPVVGKGFELADTVKLLGNLEVEMQGLNPTCMAEVMAHVAKQGVSDVREVEDVLLAHIGLVPTLERPGRPATRLDLDQKLCARLQKEDAELDGWLAEHHASVQQRLELISWQSWGTDNQIIASVQTLLEECALALGRERPKWQENFDPPALTRRSAGSLLERSVSRRIFKRLSLVPRVRSLIHSAGVDHAQAGHLLIVCVRDECGGPARELQREFEERLQCEVVIATESVEAWREEAEGASRGVVLLQTKSVLRDPVRLLQLFEATRHRHPLVCVNVVGGGYDFGTVKPLLASLPTQLSQTEIATLRTQLAEHGAGVGQLAGSLSRAVPNAISVFFNPAAGDAMVEAAIRDILHKLERKAELHSADAISDEVTMHRQRRELWAKSSRLELMVSKVSSEAASTHHGRMHATAAAVDKTIHSAAHLADEAGHSAAHAAHEAGHAAVHAMHEAGHAAAHAAHEVGHAAAHAAHEVGHAAAHAAHEVGHHHPRHHHQPADAAPPLRAVTFLARTRARSRRSCAPPSSVVEEDVTAELDEDEPQPSATANRLSAAGPVAAPPSLDVAWLQAENERLTHDVEERSHVVQRLTAELAARPSAAASAAEPGASSPAAPDAVTLAEVTALAAALKRAEAAEARAAAEADRAAAAEARAAAEAEARAAAEAEAAALRGEAAAALKAEAAALQTLKQLEQAGFGGAARTSDTAKVAHQPKRTLSRTLSAPRPAVRRVPRPLDRAREADLRT